MVWNSSKKTWCQLHEEAFRYSGGCFQYVTLDILKEGVIKPDIYDPQFNELFETSGSQDVQGRVTLSGAAAFGSVSVPP